jgi:predicted dehydrogenase
MSKIDNSRPLRIGIVGAGMVTQVVHLPVLFGLSAKFRPLGIYDVDGARAAAVSEAFSLPKRYTTPEDLAKDEEVDAALVCNSDEHHADATCVALNYQKAVLLEKPAALSLKEIDQMIALQKSAQRPVMIGYMRSFADAVDALRGQLGSLGKIKLVISRDIIGPNDYFIRQAAPVIGPQEITESFKEESKRRVSRAAVEYGIAENEPEIKRAWVYLTSVSVHDFSTLRYFFGPPQHVLSAIVVGAGEGVTVHGLFPNRVPFTYDFLIDTQGRFDARIEIFAEKGTAVLTYNTPFLRNLPTTVEWLRTENDRFEVTTERPSYVDPYTRQWEQFHRVVTADAEPRTTLAGAREDMVLIKEVISKLKR